MTNKLNKKCKDFIIDFILVIIANGIFALIIQIVMAFLRLGNGTTNKLEYASLEWFLIFINLVSFLLFFSYLVYENLIKKDYVNKNEETIYDNPEKTSTLLNASNLIDNNNVASNVINDASLFSKIEESKEIVSLSTLSEDVRQQIINEQLMSSTQNDNNYNPELEQTNNDLDIDSIITNIESNTDYQNYEDSMW